MQSYTCAKCSCKFTLMSWETVRACPECKAALPDESAVKPPKDEDVAAYETYPTPLCDWEIDISKQKTPIDVLVPSDGGEDQPQTVGYADNFRVQVGRTFADLHIPASYIKTALIKSAEVWRLDNTITSVTLLGPKPKDPHKEPTETEQPHRKKSATLLRPVTKMLLIELAGGSSRYEYLGSYSDLPVYTTVKADEHGCVVPITGKGSEFMVGRVAPPEMSHLAGKGTFIPMAPGAGQELMDRLKAGDANTLQNMRRNRFLIQAMHEIRETGLYRKRQFNFRSLDDSQREYQLRLRRFPVSYRRILEAVSPHNLASWGKTLVLKYPENIPADVEVVSVHEDHESRVFTFTLRHWSFDPINEGERVPRLDGENGECEVEIIDIAKRERERILQAIRDRFPANEGEPRPTVEMVIAMLENLA